MRVLLSVCFICHLTFNHAQLVGFSKDLQDTTKNYLARFGYIAHYSVNPKQLTSGIKQLQYFANLEVTGKLNKATVKQMSQPRCAMEDPKIKIVNRARRFIRQGTIWQKNLLTWRLQGRARNLDHETIRGVFRKALTFWSDIALINFKEIQAGEPDILVKFVTRAHDDPYHFDGRGGTLAHAFYPHNNKGLSGDVHFDDDEDFTVQSLKGRNLLFVATHELGHTLGLEHSRIRKAVMYPWYVKYTPGFKLNKDDILGVQSIYGARQAPITKPPPSTPSPAPTRRPPSNKKCPAASVKTVYYNTYTRLMIGLTSSKKLYFIRPTGGVKYGPVKTSVYLGKITGTIDAAFGITLNKREHTIIFSGSSYYVYMHFRYRSGPHSIHGNQPDDKNPLKLQFPVSVSKIDAAMTWRRNERTYFFSGSDYWRYDNVAQKLDPGYPKSIAKGWRGLPSRIDAAYSSKDQKKTFFLSGNNYYLFNDTFIRVEHGYPEHVGRDWLDCGGRSSMKQFGSLNVSNEKDDEGKSEEP